MRTSPPRSGLWSSATAPAANRTIIYVNTVGLGVQDVALGSLLLANAREKGLGTTVKMWDEPFVL